MWGSGGLRGRRDRPEAGERWRAFLTSTLGERKLGEDREQPQPLPWRREGLRPGVSAEPVQPTGLPGQGLTAAPTEARRAKAQPPLCQGGAPGPPSRPGCPYVQGLQRPCISARASSSRQGPGAQRPRGLELVTGRHPAAGTTAGERAGDPKHLLAPRGLCHSPQHRWASSLCPQL